MYFVNRSEIESLLKYFDTLWTEVTDKSQFKNRLQQLALERIVHCMIEAILDVGNRMIDGFIMRDPGSYHDIIDILIDEKVLQSNEEGAYKAMVDARQMIVQHYTVIDHARLIDILFSNQAILMRFSERIRTYLNNELGVANAFANESRGDNNEKENNEG
jgi:uncharacterized protein YutE (UPF0331/DUF86 family)